MGGGSSKANKSKEEIINQGSSAFKHLSNRMSYKPPNHKKGSSIGKDKK